MIPRNIQVGTNVKVVLGICVFLAVMTWIVFGQTLGYDSINFDDPVYVFENAEVSKGLTLHGIAWAFQHHVSGYWQPLPMITHMLDCQVYGLKPGGHHATNVVLHMLAVVLLFLVLAKMTCHVWPSAFVAALFAIHPLRVESVAWIMERKDVLSGIFFMLTLAAYLRYVRKPSYASYLLVLLLFTLGLMSKPMLVTLPFVLLLLDYWPLRRFTAPVSITSDMKPLPRQDGQSIVPKLIWEKVPLLLFAAVACGIALVLEKEVLSSIDAIPFWVRLYNAAVSYVAYIWQMFWPVKLALFYPFPSGALSGRKLILAVAVLCAGTYTAWVLRKQRPYFITGWFWYLGMLLPIIGLVQVGGQARADRYTYLPQIGLYLAATWAAADLSASWRYRRQILGTLAAVVIGLLTWRTWVQTSYWKNSESIWTRTLAVTSNNAVAHLSLGYVSLEGGQLDSAIFHFQESLKIFSQSPLYGFSAAFAHHGLGNALLGKGLVADAIPHYRKALQIKPNYAKAEYDLGRALFREERIDEAITHWQRALSLDPHMANAYASLGDALLRKHLTGEAIACYEKSLQIAPQSAPVLNVLAWVLSTRSDSEVRNGPRAIQLAEQANQLSRGKNPVFMRTLAAAYAESGRFSDAIDAAQRALQLAVAKGDSALAGTLRMDIDLYRMNFPRR
jgi:tetratricopeptide (TPR) repeat protein